MRRACPEAALGATCLAHVCAAASTDVLEVLEFGWLRVTSFVSSMLGFCSSPVGPLTRLARPFSGSSIEHVSVEREVRVGKTTATESQRRCLVQGQMRSTWFVTYRSGEPGTAEGVLASA